MFPYTKFELCELIDISRYEFPQILHIWSYDQDDGFGNLVSTVDWCLLDVTRTTYIVNFIGYDSSYEGVHVSNYGDH